MLQSRDLSIRALEPTDVDFMYDVENDTCAWNYSDTIAPLSRRILMDYALTYNADPFAAGQLRLILTLHDSGAQVGIIDLYDISLRHRRAYIGIYLCKCYRGKGYASESLKLIEDYAHKVLHLHQLASKVEDGNKKAVELFQKNGYELMGLLKDWLRTGDENFVDVNIFAKKLSGTIPP